MTGKELIKQILDKGLVDAEVVVYNAAEEGDMNFITIEVHNNEETDEPECMLVVD